MDNIRKTRARRQWPSRFWSLGPDAVVTLLDGNRRRALSDQAQSAYDGTVAILQLIATLPARRATSMPSSRKRSRRVTSARRWIFRDAG